MIEIRRAKGKQAYYAVIKARNGKVLATTETYLTKAGVRKGIRAIERTFEVLYLLGDKA